MNRLAVLLLLPALFACGCVSNSKAKADAQAAFFAGQRQAEAAAAMQAPHVTVRGEVRRPIVPWTEDLTLARAIVAAEYTSFFDPREIILIRNGETFKFNARRLARGGEDPPLEPGDIVEIHR